MIDDINMGGYKKTKKKPRTWATVENSGRRDLPNDRATEMETHLIIIFF